MRDGKTTVSGSDKRALRRALDGKIKKGMDEVYESLAKAQKTYDEETRHGTALVAQLRHRQWQRAELEKLADEKGDKTADRQKNYTRSQLTTDH
jgi:hypothetical protein